MSALRGSVLYTSADDTEAIFGLGIDETDVLTDTTVAAAIADAVATAVAADVTAVTTLATTLADRIVTFVSAVDSPTNRIVGADEEDTIIAVEGIETEDVIISAFKVGVEVAQTVGIVATVALQPVVNLEDVTADASVSDTDEVTFSDVAFESGTALVLTYMDVSRPDENA